MEEFLKKQEERGAIPQYSILALCEASFGESSPHVLKHLEEVYGLKPHIVLPEEVWEPWEEVLKQLFPT
ncbi:MAG: hypothetical protein DLD55_01660 [candidate division SR1 bacterium]|nr:MAG: hypothetical protein DLD55_01660 [candidate division SR1 bacterium]